MLVYVPILLLLPAYWIRRDSGGRLGHFRIVGLLAFLVFGIVPGAALLVTLCLKHLTPYWSVVAAGLLLCLVAHPHWGPLRWIHDKLFGHRMKTWADQTSEACSFSSDETGKPLEYGA